MKLRPSNSLCRALAAFGALLTLAPTASADSAARLPNGVHLTRAGRYVEDICKVTPETAGKPRCLGRWLLPADWTPDQPLPAHRRAGTPEASSCTTADIKGLGPADLAAAYQIPASAKANGKIVAIVEIAGQDVTSDLAIYRSAVGLDPLPTCTTVPSGSGAPCLAQVDSETGLPAAPTGNINGQTPSELALVSATCPDCSIIVVGISAATLSGAVSMQANGWQPFVDAVATAKYLGASAVTIAFGGVEDTDPNVLAAGLSDGGADVSGVYSSGGTTVFVASGDYGYDNMLDPLTSDGGVVGASPSYPSSAPDVVAVGSTMLIDTDGGYQEAVWNDGVDELSYEDITTSGCSSEFAMPSWQSSVLSGTSCAKRATVDMAAAAAFAKNGTVEDITYCAAGQPEVIEGPCVASAVAAALFTRLGLASDLSVNLGQLYTNAAGFNDLGSATYPVSTVTCGDAGPCGSSTNATTASPTCGKLCTAGTGWDGPSGVGTPNATALAALTWQPGPTPVSLFDGGAIGGGSSSGGSSSSGSSSGGSSSGSSSGAVSSSSSSSGSSSGGGGGGGGEDGGASGDGGANGDSGAAPSSGCSCRVAGTDVSGLGPLALAAGVMALGARRRGKRRSG